MTTCMIRWASDRNRLLVQELMSLARMEDGTRDVTCYISLVGVISIRARTNLYERSSLGCWIQYGRNRHPSPREGDRALSERPVSELASSQRGPAIPVRW